MNEKMKSNLSQIESLRNSKQTREVNNILCKRVAQARSEVNSLRAYSLKKSGTRPALICSIIADEIEATLKGL